MRFERTEQLVLDIQMIVAELMQLSSCDTMFGREDIFNDLLERRNRVANCINEPPYYSISIVRELEENAGNDVSKLTDLFKLWKNRLDKIKIPKDEWFSEISFWLDGDDKHLRAFQIAHNVKTYTEIINDAVTQFCRDNNINCDYVDLWQQDEPQDSDSDNNSLEVEPIQSFNSILPEKLKTSQLAIAIFQKAIRDGLIEKTTQGLCWKESKQLLAYFAEKMSNEFSLTVRLDRNGNKTTSWKPFEKIFNFTDLKGAKQNWMRLNTRFEPTGYKKVDDLF